MFKSRRSGYDEISGGTGQTPTAPQQPTSNKKEGGVSAMDKLWKFFMSPKEGKEQPAETTHVSQQRSYGSFN